MDLLRYFISFDTLKMSFFLKKKLKVTTKGDAIAFARATMLVTLTLVSLNFHSPLSLDQTIL
jgi:hypothetical protein